MYLQLDNIVFTSLLTYVYIFIENRFIICWMFLARNGYTLKSVIYYFQNKTLISVSVSANKRHFNRFFFVIPCSVISSDRL